MSAKDDRTSKTDLWGAIERYAVFLLHSCPCCLEPRASGRQQHAGDNRLNPILSLLQPLDRCRTPSAIGSAIGRPSLAVSRIHTGRSSQPPHSKPLMGLNRAIVALCVINWGTLKSLRGGNGKGGIRIRLPVHCLSARSDRQPYCRTNATSSPWFQDDLSVRDNCLPVHCWHLASRRATSYCDPGCHAYVVSPCLLTACLHVVRWAKTPVLKTDTRMSKR